MQNVSNLLLSDLADFDIITVPQVIQSWKHL